MKQAPTTTRTPETEVKTPRSPLLIFKFLVMYWKVIFVIIYPLVLLPTFMINNTAPFRCLYVVLLMSGYWVFEVLPLAVTSLLPMFLFPLMGILDSDKVSACYMKETNMMFVGGLIIALAVEYCNLHTRIALYVIRFVGCSPRRLNIGLCSVTMFVSMWISNTAATAMMIPIVDATLKALEDQGIGHIYEVPDLNNDPKNQEKRPTSTTMCYFISTAYAASIGGLGCIIGSGTNLAFQGLFETTFPQSPGIDFTKWMLLNVPLMLISMYLSVVWLQFYFMGLFRPNSADAKSIDIGKEGEAIAEKCIQDKIKEMGPMTFHEKAVGVLFILAILLWFFRKPLFIPGWAEQFTNLKVKDASAAMIICILLFIIPQNLDFLNFFNTDEGKRPTSIADPLVTWKYIQQKMSWGLIFLLGGGFAIAEAAKASGMSKMVADNLGALYSLNRYYIMLIAGFTGAVLTQFSSNVAVANIILPVMATIAQKSKLNPLFLMLPAGLSCSYAYCLPVSTPPNAIAQIPINMPTWEMVKVGLGMMIISCAVCYSIFPFYGKLIWDLDEFPDWANATTGN